MTKIGFSQSVISRSSPILISRSSGPVQSGCRQAERWSIPFGRSRMAATRSEILWPSSIPPPPGLAPWPITISIASQRRRSTRVHAVAGGEELVDERRGVPALLLGHAAVARRGRGAHRGRAAARAPPWRAPDSAPKLMPGDRDRDLQVQRPGGVAVAEHDVGVAALAVALERIARDARAEEEQVVEVRQPALGAPAPDVVDALARGALDLGDHVAVEGGRLAQGRQVRRRGVAGHQSPASSTSNV